MRKYITCFVLLLLVFISLFTFALAKTKPRMEVSGRYEYLFNKDGTVSYGGYHHEIGDNRYMTLESFSVPKTIDGYTVTAIYNYAFSVWKSLKEVTIPDTIKTIGEGAFNNCISLRSLVLPEGVVEIGPSFLVASGVETVVIPSTVTTIDKKAFSGALSLKEIIVTKGSYAEKYCKNNNLPFTYSDSVEEGNDSKNASEAAPAGVTDSWYDYGAGLYLPKPQLKSGEDLLLGENMMNADAGFYALVTNAEVIDFEMYIRVMKQAGYAIVDRSNIHAKMSNDNGYEVYIIFDESLGMEVSCMAPVP